jgi:acylphosphatase
VGGDRRTREDRAPLTLIVTNGDDEIKMDVGEILPRLTQSAGRIDLRDTPASTSCWSTSGASDAGPTVATIFVRLAMPRILAAMELLLIRHALPIRREIDEGRADPVDVAMSLAAGARAGGVRIVEGVPVLDVLTSHGAVTGVRTAIGLQLTGWVRNCSDGSVETVAEGDLEKIKEFTEWCRRGPSRAHVDHVDEQPSEFKGEFEEFEVRY